MSTRGRETSLAERRDAPMRGAMRSHAGIGLAARGNLSHHMASSSGGLAPAPPSLRSKRRPMTNVTSIAELEAIYGTANLASTSKEIDYLDETYVRLIEASPFVVMATAGPEGLDCSPRGDAGSVVRITSAKRLLMPDRRGNNRIDTLRNIVRDPRIALLFLIPGSGTTLRVNGRASISVEPALLSSFAVDGKAPRTVVAVDVERVYFQCARAVVRSRIWDTATHVDPATLPTPGDILARLSDDRVGGAAYDAEWPERAQKTLW